MPATSELIPPNEAARLAAVHRYDVLDTPADGSFDRITRIASRVLDMPVAIISIVDTDRIWFKSALGVGDVDEIGRDPGLCASAILHDSLWEVTDAAVDARTLANPLVAGDFGLRFYAGQPLTTSDGFNLGTLCVIDHAPRQLDDRQREILEDLACLVVDELELRLAARRANRDSEARQRYAGELNDDVVQMLAEAKLSAHVGDQEGTDRALSSAMEASKRILTELVGDATHFRRRPTSSEPLD